MLFPQPAALFPDGDADGKLFVKTVSEILLVSAPDFIVLLSPNFPSPAFVVRE